MQIRKAHIADMAGIVRCAQDFFIYAKFADYGLTLDETSFREMVVEHIYHGVVLLLVDDDNNVKGGIAGMIHPWGFNKSIRILMELFFWIDPDCRGTYAIRMHRAFEKAARSSGADRIMMMSVNTELAEGVGRMYEKFGYKLLERFYIKDV